MTLCRPSAFRPFCRFWKLSPGGNPTLLLPADAVPPDRRATLAKGIMKGVMDDARLDAEQVGFIRLPDPTGQDRRLPRLDMMGGEFCLNATRAFALLLAMRGLLPRARTLPGDTAASRCWRGEVETSGADKPVAVAVREFEEQGLARFQAQASLSLETLPRAGALPGGLERVRLPGIVHLILRQADRPAADRVPGLCETLRRVHGLEAEDAVGVLWLAPDDADDAITRGPAETAVMTQADKLARAAQRDRHAADASTGLWKLFPAVWVRATQSLCLESACGSGTLACALALRGGTNAANFSIRQPSGDVLSVTLERDPARSPNPSGQSWLATVDGPARLEAEGSLDLTAFQGNVQA